MKNICKNHIVTMPLPGIFVVMLGLVLSPNAYAVHATTAYSAGNSIMVASGRPYNHLNRSNHGSINIKQHANTNMQRTMKRDSNRPYSHIRRSPAMEQSEFAAMETGNTSKQRLHRNASQGGKPYRLR